MTALTAVVAASATDVGRLRSVNEDAAFVGSQLVVVADGLGGHQAGDVASALAVARFAELDASPLTPEGLTAAVSAANDDLLRYAAAHPEAEGLGTTIAGVGAVDVAGVPHWAVFNVGDSRVYRFVHGQLSRATVDHSETEELLLTGRIGDESLVTPEERSIITRSLGSRPAPTVDLWLLPVLGSERLLVCSDGLWSEVDDDRIAEVLASAGDPSEACAALVEDALRAGGSDNITVAVVEPAAVGTAPDLQRTNPRHRVTGPAR